MSKVKKVFIILSILLPVFAFAEEPFPNEPTGFRGIKWGTDLSKIPDMMLLKDNGDIKLYIKRGEKLKIVDSELISILYKTFNNKLFSVIIDFEADFKGYLKLRNVLVSLYGYGYTTSSRRFLSKDFTPYYWWTSFWRGDKVRLTLTYNSGSTLGKIFYDYKPIKKEYDAKESEERQKQIKEDAKRAKEDL